MKLSVVALAIMASLTLGAPTRRHDDSDNCAVQNTTERAEWKGWYKGDGSLRTFTSYIRADATADQVVNSNNTAAPGFGNGTFTFALNSDDNYICWAIRAYIRGEYQSPAITATHIHEAAVGRAGPPRIALKNPVIEGDASEADTRYSYGCLDGPFRTGINATGTTTDTAANFTIAQLEASPQDFFADTHTAEFVPGAIRGQLASY